MTAKGTDRLTIALAQMNQRVGDLEGNANAMLEMRRRASGADLVVFPELQLIGYPPEDLVLKPALAESAELELKRLVEATGDGGTAMLIGSARWIEGKLYNILVLADGGEEVAVRLKHELPNYGTFDEKRVFAPGPIPSPVDWRGVRLGLPICEDIWFPAVCQQLKAQGAELLIAPHGSPYETHKDDLRSGGIAARRVAETGLPLIFLNRVGGQDEIVFDGSSFVMNGDGKLVQQLADWEEELRITEWRRVGAGWRCEPGEIHMLDPYPADIYHAMMVGLRDYVSRNGFPGVILGLSGGIDSALSAAVAVDALGPDKVWGVMLPSKYTSRESLQDAEGCARLLGIRHDVISIEAGVDALDDMLAAHRVGNEPGLAEENMQSRLRMLTLMALSNRFGHMLLTTGNKSEMSVGYATLYGDMAGGYSVLKDAYKMTVFALSRWRNANRPEWGLGPDGPVMPERVITKAPSAELRPGQKDEDSLPPYLILDSILEALVEQEMSVAEAASATGAEESLVADIEGKLLRAEYKRRQAPPGVKLGRRNFGRDRRYPISNFFHTGRR